MRSKLPLAVSRHFGRSRALVLALGFVSFVLGGCTVITGMPEPITDKDVKSANVCPSYDQLKSYYASTTPEGFADRASYRNFVIATCVEAVNRNYKVFRRKLQAEAVSSGLVTDIASLVLTSGASLTKGSVAKELSAGATVVIGTGSAIDKDVFFQQALPGITSQLDANRDAAYQKIVDHLAGDKTGSSYDLGAVVADIDELEAAGNVYRAISDLTKTANETAKSASKSLSVSQNLAYYKVPIIAAAPEARLKNLLSFVRHLKDPDDRSKLDQIATAVGLTPDASEKFDDEQVDVVSAIEKFVVSGDPDAQMTAMEGKLKTFYKPGA